MFNMSDAKTVENTSRRKNPRKKLKKRPSYVSTPVRQRVANLRACRQGRTNFTLRYRPKKLMDLNIISLKTTKEKDISSLNDSRRETISKTMTIRDNNSSDSEDESSAVKSRDKINQSNSKVKAKRHGFFHLKRDRKPKEKSEEVAELSKSSDEGISSVKNVQDIGRNEIQEWTRWRCKFNDHLVNYVMSHSNKNELHLDLTSSHVSSLENLMNFIGKAHERNDTRNSLSDLAYIVYGIPRTHLKQTKSKHKENQISWKESKPAQKEVSPVETVTETISVKAVAETKEVEAIQRKCSDVSESSQKSKLHPPQRLWAPTSHEILRAKANLSPL